MSELNIFKGNWDGENELAVVCATKTKAAELFGFTRAVQMRNFLPYTRVLAADDVVWASPGTVFQRPTTPEPSGKVWRLRDGVISQEAPAEVPSAALVVGQQPAVSLLAGATLSCGNGGAVCIHNAASQRLWRFDPVSSYDDQELSSILAQCHSSARDLAQKTGPVIEETPAQQAALLLLELKGALEGAIRQMRVCLNKEDSASSLLAFIEDTNGLIQKVDPVIDALNASLL